MLGYNWTSSMLVKYIEEETTELGLHPSIFEVLKYEGLTGKHLPLLADTDNVLLENIFPIKDTISMKIVRNVCFGLMLFGDLNG